MPKGKGEQNQLEPTEEAREETQKAQAQPEPQTEAPTEEMLPRSVVEKQLAGLHRQIAKRDARIRELEARTTQGIGGDDNVRTLELMLQSAKARAEEYGETDPTIAMLEAEIAKRKARLEQQKFQEYVQQQIEAKRAEIEGKIEAAGEDPTDEKFDTVWDAFDVGCVTADFSRADQRLARLLGSAKPKEQKAEEGDEETIGKKVEEGIRKWLVEHGYLNSDTGQPSGGAVRTFTREQVRDREFWEANKDEILKAHRAGLIK